MKKIVPLFPLFLLLSASLFSQSEVPPEVRKVFRLAQQGHDNLDAAPLLEAIRLLIKHPEIRQMVIVEASHGQAPDPGQETGDYRYFDPDELIEYAEIYAPFDDKKLQRKIRRLKNKIPEGYEPLGLRRTDDSRIENGSYLVLPNNTREITKSFSTEGMVYLTIQYGGELKLKVRQPDDNRLLGNEESNRVVKYLDFNVHSPGDYKIIIENKSEAEKTCYLRVEYN